MEIKKAYQEKADAQLHEWQTWIEQFRLEQNGSISGRLADRQRMMQRLEDCHRIARVQLDELRSSQEDRWELTKQAVERAMIDLKAALDESGAANSGRFLQLQSSRSHIYEPFQRR